MGKRKYIGRGGWVPLALGLLLGLGALLATELLPEALWSRLRVWKHRGE